MANNFYQEYSYNSCISKGICSINPKTSSLQEILLLYLRTASFYALKLEEANLQQKKIRKLILDTLSIMITNPQFSESDFNNCAEAFIQNIPILISEYEEYCKNTKISPEYIKTSFKYNKKTDIIKSIRLGEKEFYKRIQELSEQTISLYKIMFAIAKSICTNVLDLETYDFNADEGYLEILKILNKLNVENIDNEKLLKFIVNASNTNMQLMKLLRQKQIERYGEQKPKTVSYSTVSGKAVLVVGSNIRELEDVLEAVKDKDIGVYTHDEMMLAHTFPKFSEYQNLKGQYGRGMETCLLDFATFPGPIIMTRHSLYNIENLYRGRLFTTDNAYIKGVISINSSNFGEVIQSAIESRGFKKGKQCETETVGFVYEEFFNCIKQKLTCGKYSQVVIIDSRDSGQEHKEYFNSLSEKLPKNILLVFLTKQEAEYDNVVSVNACYDSFAAVRLTDDVINFAKIPVTVFFPICGIHTVSDMIYLVSKPKVEVFAGKCTPIVINPILLKYLSEFFGIKTIKTVKNDLEIIVNHV